jgi:hypothetical protein
LSYTSHDCDGAPQAGDRFGFRYADSTGARNSITAEVPAGQGPASSFFSKPPGQLRFELKQVDMIGEDYTAIVIDRQPNKDGREYEIGKGAKKGTIIRDFTATFVLNAIGQGANLIEVEENGRFALPFDAQSGEKPFRFKEVRQGAGGLEVVIEESGAGEMQEHLLPAPAK